MSLATTPARVDGREVRGEDIVGRALREQGVRDLFDPVIQAAGGLLGVLGSARAATP